MLIGIVIGIVSVLVVLQLERYAMLFPKKTGLKRCILRLNYFWQTADHGDMTMAARWSKVVGKMLTEEDIDTYLQYICKDPIGWNLLAGSEFKKILCTMDVRELNSVYESCINKGFKESAEFICALVRNKIVGEKNRRLKNILKGFLCCGELYENCIIPAIAEKLSEQHSFVELEREIVELEEIEGSTKEIQKLIDERILEILMADAEEHWPEHLIEVYFQLEKDSAAEKFWLERIEAALDELVSNIDIGLVAKWLEGIQKNSSSQPKDLGVRRVVLSKLVPTMDKDAINAWAPQFPEYLNYFAKRIRELYATEPINVLAGNYENFEKLPDLCEVFDKLMMKWVMDNQKPYKINIEDLIMNWNLLPYNSKACKLASSHIRELYALGNIKIVPVEASA
jgi:hypothetical protein